MYQGEDLWKRERKLVLEEREGNGRRDRTYRGLPDHLYGAVKKTASGFWEKTCIVDDDGTRLTFGSFMELVDELADYLSVGMQVRPGDHVALLMFNCREFCVAFLALNKLGAMVQPLPSKFKQKEILALLEKADCRLVICEERFAGWMEPVRERGTGVLEVKSGPGRYGFAYLLRDFERPARPVPCRASADGEAVLIFTSGTTSKSKGAVLSNFNIMHAVETYIELLRLTPEDSSIIAVPIYHVTGLIAILGVFLCLGGTVYLHRIFNAGRVLECVRENRITFLHGAPTVFSMLLGEQENFPELPSLRAFACGSSNMPKEKIRMLHRWLPGMDFHTVYGLTETSSPATIFPGDAAESPYIGSSGLPIPGTVFRVTDEEGRELPPGETGEIQVKGSVVLKEYYEMKTETLSEDGWLATGDLGYFNEEGYIFLVDRKKDIINRGGEKICSYDVENELYLFPEIEEAAVVGIPDELYGESAAAVVKCREGASLTEGDIQELLYERIAKYKIPKRVLFVDHLPETPNGKIDKKRIRELFRNQKEEENL